MSSAETSKMKVDRLQANEGQRLRLHNLVLQQQICREQLNGLVLQFLQSAKPRALQEKIDALTNQINEAAQLIYSEAGVDPNLYQFNVETGHFVQREQPAADPTT